MSFDFGMTAARVTSTAVVVACLALAGHDIYQAWKAGQPAEQVVARTEGSAEDNRETRGPVSATVFYSTKSADGRFELTTGLEIGRVAPDAIPEVSYCYVAKPGAGGSTAAAVIFVAKREGLNAPVFTTWEWDARLLGLTAAQLETMAREGCLFADSPADLKEKSAARDASRPAPRSREERHA